MSACVLILNFTLKNHKLTLSPTFLCYIDNDVERLEEYELGDNA